MWNENLSRYIYASACELSQRLPRSITKERAGWESIAAAQTVRRWSALAAAAVPVTNAESASETSRALHRLHSLLQRPFVALGLDVNTRSTGYALVSSASTQPLALARGCVQMARDADLYNKVQQIGRTVYDDVLRATADAPTIPLVIGVEAYMRQYAGGRFRTQALFRQAELNTLAAYELSRLFRTGCVPLQVHPNEARAWWGISRLAEGDMSGSPRAKQLMLHRVARYVMPPPTGESNQLDSALSTAVSHDVTDAFVVAHYTMVLEQEARAMTDVPLFVEFLREHPPETRRRTGAMSAASAADHLWHLWRRRHSEEEVSAGDVARPLSWALRTRVGRAYGRRLLERIEAAQRQWVRQHLRTPWDA